MKNLGIYKILSSKSIFANSENAYQESDSTEIAGDAFFVYGLGVHQFFETIWSYIIILALMSVVAGFQMIIVS